ncbi:MAG: class I SAM-dependent methyltransferase, partial [Pseudomonadota bacterium]
EATEDWKGLSADVTTAARAALLGCYEPLFRRALGPGGAGRLAALSTLSPHPGFQDLFRIQVTEPLAEIALEPTIPALGSIDDDVSRAVRRQYEENPYPRWTSVGAPAAEEAGAAPTGSRPGILIAGCGTGREAVEAALLFPAARVDAIDLSRASLAYGARKAAEMGVDNLFFQQADILDLKRIDKSFDLIMSSGVLHHMKDPQAGLRSLLGVLRPGGILRLGLYSTIARHAISQARDWIARDGFAATPEGIRAFRAAVIARADDDPVKKALVASYDFYSLSQCRDLLFHVQEHTFTLPQIADMARAFELRVLRVDTRSPAHRTAYHARFPHDDEATNLANWHLHEQDNPTTFAGLYSLWLCRSADTDIADMTWVPGNPGDARPV